jgi:hypothetical protein
MAIKAPSRMMIINLVFLTIITAGVIYGYQQWRFAKIAAGYAAKQICSCYFVSNRDYDSCRADIGPGVERLEITFIDRTVLVNAGGFDNAAATMTPGFGCSVVDAPPNGF